jgi:DNA polymerase III sliding clamp (beta) subunit (PCNA family)
MSLSFKINVNALIEGVEPAAVVATNKGVIKDFAGANHVSLETSPDCLFVNANGGRLSLRHPIPYMTSVCTDYAYKEAGTATVKAADLLSVLDSFKENEILLVETVDSAVIVLDDKATEEEKSAVAQLSGTELKLTPQSDPDQYQTLPILSVPISMPSASGNPNQTVVLPTKTLCAAIKQILFAGGFEETRAKYLYWKLHIDPTMNRFIAGSGPRFACLDLRGDNIASSTEPTDLLLPVEQSGTSEKVFAASVSPMVTINHYGNRISFESGDLRLVCVGMDPNIHWVKENDILQKPKLFSFTVAIADLEMAAKGILATNSDFANKRYGVHGTTLSFDADARVLSFYSDRSTKKALRKVPIADVWLAPFQPTTITFKCGAAFIGELVKCSGLFTYVQFDLISKDFPIIARFTADAKTSATPVFVPSQTMSAEESFTMFIVKLNDN